jgi:hypothetical protein
MRKEITKIFAYISHIICTRPFQPSRKLREFPYKNYQYMQAENLGHCVEVVSKDILYKLKWTCVWVEDIYCIPPLHPSPRQMTARIALNNVFVIMIYY